MLPLLWAKVKRKRSNRKLSRGLSLKKALRVLRLALRLRRGKWLGLISSWSFFRSPRGWTPLQLERKLGIL